MSCLRQDGLTLRNFEWEEDEFDYAAGGGNRTSVLIVSRGVVGMGLCDSVFVAVGSADHLAYFRTNH
jgi:hypothetical protein